MPVKKPKPPQRVLKSTDPAMRRFVKARTDTRLLGSIDRMLVTERAATEIPGHEDYRREDVLHPSEISKPDWCPKASWHRIRLANLGVVAPPELNSMRLETIFEEGHDIHAKWQRWAWSVGILEGIFDCLRCDHRWWDRAPSRCPSCDGSRRRLRYREVPIDGVTEFLVLGHADGKLTHPEWPDSILEVKSMSAGTVRTEWPQGLGRHTKKFTDTEGFNHSYLDIEALWRDIRRPFPSHLRQGNIYGKIHGVDWLTYVYENKSNQGYKEFNVKVDESIWGPILDLALDVKWALEKDRPPNCPKGIAGCKYCNPYEPKKDNDRPRAARGPKTTPTPHPRAARGPGESGRGAGRDSTDTPKVAPRYRPRRPAVADDDVGRADGAGVGTGGTGVTSAPARADAGTTRRADGLGGRGPDGGDAPVHRVGRLPRRPTLVG